MVIVAVVIVAVVLVVVVVVAVISSSSSISSSSPPTPCASACESFCFTTDPRNSTTSTRQLIHEIPQLLRTSLDSIVLLFHLDDGSIGPLEPQFLGSGGQMTIRVFQIVSDPFRLYQIVDEAFPVVMN